MHYAENECAMPIRMHYNELRALCLATNALCRAAKIGALLLKCVLIVYIWPEKDVYSVREAPSSKRNLHLGFDKSECDGKSVHTLETGVWVQLEVVRYS